MALRAGYYGVKRRVKDKIEKIAAVWDETIASSYNTDNMRFIRYNVANQVVNANNYAQINAPAIPGYKCMMATTGLSGSGFSLYASVVYSYNSTTKELGSIRVQNRDTENHTWDVYGQFVYVKEDFIYDYVAQAPDNVPSPDRSVEVNDTPDEQPVKKTTSKKSTAKTETSKEV